MRVLAGDGGLHLWEEGRGKWEGIRRIELRNTCYGVSGMRSVLIGAAIKNRLH